MQQYCSLTSSRNSMTKMDNDLCPSCGAYWVCGCGQPRQGNGSALMPASTLMYDTSALQAIPSMPEWLTKYLEEHPDALKSVGFTGQMRIVGTDV